MKREAGEWKEEIDRGVAGTARSQTLAQRVFSDEMVQASQSRYMSRVSALADCVFRQQEAKMELTIAEYIQAGYAHVQLKSMQFIQDHLDGGKFYDLNKIGDGVKRIPPTNDPCETQFGCWSIFKNSRAART